MRKRYYKDIDGSRIWYKGVIVHEVIREVPTADGGTEELNELVKTYTWDKELILADGWTEYIPEPVPPYEPTYEEKVRELISQKYDWNEEAKIEREYNASLTPEIEMSVEDKTVAKEAFIEYHNYVVWCHEEAKKNEE